MTESIKGKTREREKRFSSSFDGLFDLFFFSPPPSTSSSFFLKKKKKQNTGMTLGIMGLDKVGLQILATAGDSEKERRYAKVLIPVWEGHRQNIIGILYTKDLILVDPDDEVEVRAIIALQGCASGGGNNSDGVQYILDVTPLNEVFKLFKTCGTHLMASHF